MIINIWTEEVTSVGDETSNCQTRHPLKTSLMIELYTKHHLKLWFRSSYREAIHFRVIIHICFYLLKHFFTVFIEDAYETQCCSMDANITSIRGDTNAEDCHRKLTRDALTEEWCQAILVNTTWLCAGVIFVCAITTPTHKHVIEATVVWASADTFDPPSWRRHPNNHELIRVCLLL